VKAAAPQAPGSTHTTAQTSAKGRAASAKPAGAAAFAGVLAQAVAANGRLAPATSARTAVRTPVASSALHNGNAGSTRAKAAGRDAARAAGQRRADERTAAEQTVGRTAAAALHPAAPAVVSPSDPRTAGAAAAARRAEPRVQVVDLRKKSTAADPPDASRARSAGPSEKGEGSSPTAKPFSEQLGAAEAPSKPTAPARATPLERILEMNGADLVRTAGLVVRDGGGEIRLTLKPESLGSVRIRLSLEDGMVEGRIIVDTPEARQAFEAGLDELTRALHADGFQTGSLSVSVSGGNTNDSRQAAGLLGDTITGARLRASDEALQAAVPPAGWIGGGDGLVNVFA
jgi:flagellar hook-length control protein FliK